MAGLSGASRLGARIRSRLPRRTAKFDRTLAAANAARDAERWPEAARLFEEAFNLRPSRQDLAIQAGNACKEAGAGRQAVAWYDTVTAADEIAEARLQKTDALLRMGAEEEALASYAEAAAASLRSGGIAASVVRVADRWREAGEWRRAARAYDVLRDLAAEPAHFAMQAGRCWTRAGDVPRAIAIFDGIGEPARRLDALLGKAAALFQDGRTEAGVATLIEAEAAGLDKADARLAEMSETLVADAGRTRAAGDTAGAASLLVQAWRCLPRRADVLREAADLFRQAGEIGQALAVYDLLPDLPGDREALFGKAEALFAGGDLTGAMTSFEAASAAGHRGARDRLFQVIISAQDGSLRRPGPAAPKEGFPILDVPIAEGELLNRLTSGNSRRDLLGWLDRASHESVLGEAFKHEPHVEFDQIGWLTLVNEGRKEPLLMGIVAVRARILSTVPLTRADLVLRTTVIASQAPALVEQHASGQRLYVVNMWVDCARLRPCRSDLTLWAADARGRTLSATRMVNVAQTPLAIGLASSDCFVPSPQSDCDDVAAEVLARPALVRQASRVMFPEPITRLLVMRVDQLGDVSAALPAIQRLRELFPRAHLTGLVSSALCELVAATGLCDDVLGLTLIYDHASERRFLPDAEEERITQLLGRTEFDLAIDLCPADETRPLLKLVNAKYLVGFHPREFRFLDFGVDVFSRDKVNQAGIISHGAHISVLVEGLAAALRPAQPIVRRVTDDRALLARYGVEAGRYVVVHSGARHAINCWPLPNFVRLATRIADEIGLLVVFFSDEAVDPVLAATVPAGRVRFAGKMPMSHFGALVASSHLMIGNDSGPKHLAAVHGVETVSVHVNRLNWREWGQDGQGVIISKQVPCCGCGLNNLALCGRQAACITTIGVDEVFAAVAERLDRRAASLPPPRAD